MTREPGDPLQTAWSKQPEAGDEVDLDRARTALRQREAGIRKRDRIMYACAAIIAPSWAAIMWFMPDLRLIAAVGFATAVWVSAQMYRRSAARIAPVSAGIACTEYQAELLGRERDLYLAMPKWYLIPVGLSQVAILVALFTSPRFPQTSGLLLGAALMVGSAVAVLFGASRRWRRLAMELQRELDTVNMLRGGDSFRSVAGCVLALVVLGTTAASQSAGLLSDQAIRSVLANRVDVERQHVGVVVGVIEGAGRRVVGHGTFGKSDARPVDGHTVFEIGSVTKVFTSLLLAEMAGRGEVAIDDPVAKHLPAGVTVPMRGTTAITLQDLATHTSGLPRLPTNLVVTNMDNPYANYSVENLHAFLSGYVLTRDIGTQFEYSNLGVGVLGHALALRARSDYETLVKTRILGPLEMRETSIQLSQEMTGRLAAGHNARLEPAGNWDIPTLAGAGALRSTVSDMLQFLSAFVGTTKSELSPAMARMLSVRRPAMAGMTSALGWQVVTRDGVEMIWHNGATGGYSAFVGYMPSRAVGVVVLANNAGAAGSGVDDLGMHLLDPRMPLAKPIPKRTRITVDPAILARYAGTYEIAPGFLVAVAHEEGRLFVTPPGQPRHEIFAESERMFFTTIADVQFSFDVDATGPAKAMTLHQAGKSTTGKRVDVAAMPPAPARQVVAVKPDVLETFVGRYQLTPAVFITVTRQDARLFAQATGQGAFELFAESEDRFFAKVGGIEIWFDRDAQGRSLALNIRQGGVTRQLKRVE